MQNAKDTARALVRIGYDGSVHKFFRAADARERFENELRVLRYLEQQGCDFVPRVLGFDREKLELVTSNCGARVEHLGDARLHELFAELERFGVRHDDPFLRNVTYRASDGRFCIIDFEFATIVEPSAGVADDDEVPVAIIPAATAPESELCWSGCTDRGPIRPNNEDAFLTIAFDARDMHYLGSRGTLPAKGMDFVFAVSDGMGGERSGEYASKFALDNIIRLLPRRFQMSPAHTRYGVRECLRELFHGIHNQLTRLGRVYPEARNMGATLSLMWYVESWVFFGHVGDSRIYYLPQGGPRRQLTDDHTHVGWLRRSGKLNERQARTHPRKNVLTQSLGAGHQFLKPQFGELRCEPGDRFILCTDGVVEGIWDHALEELGRRPTPAAGTLAGEIVRQAITESGRDNATAVVVERVR